MTLSELKWHFSNGDVLKSEKGQNLLSEKQNKTTLNVIF